MRACVRSCVRACVRACAYLEHQKPEHGDAGEVQTVRGVVKHVAVIVQVRPHPAGAARPRAATPPPRCARGRVHDGVALTQEAEDVGDVRQSVTPLRRPVPRHVLKHPAQLMLASHDFLCVTQMKGVEGGGEGWIVRGRGWRRERVDNVTVLRRPVPRHILEHPAQLTLATHDFLCVTQGWIVRGGGGAEKGWIGGGGHGAEMGWIAAF